MGGCCLSHVPIPQDCSRLQSFSNYFCPAAPSPRKASYTGRPSQGGWVIIKTGKFSLPCGDFSEWECLAQVLLSLSNRKHTHTRTHRLCVKGGQKLWIFGWLRHCWGILEGGTNRKSLQSSLWRLAAERWLRAELRLCCWKIKYSLVLSQKLCWRLEKHITGWWLNRFCSVQYNYYLFWNKRLQKSKETQQHSPWFLFQFFFWWYLCQVEMQHAQTRHAAKTLTLLAGNFTGPTGASLRFQQTSQLMLFMFTCSTMPSPPLLLAPLTISPSVFIWWWAIMFSLSFLLVCSVAWQNASIWLLTTITSHHSQLQASLD